jgi:hypothetical protein
MSPWKSNDRTSPVFAVLGILLLSVPLILAVTWGAYFRDAAFVTLQAAQSLVADQSRLAPRFALGIPAQAPLYMGLLAVAGRFAPQAALVFNALGWSAVTFLVYYSLRAAARPLAAIISALLLVFNPLVLFASGTEYSWVLALGLATLALTVSPQANPRRAAWLNVVLLLLLLGLHFNAATILFALALLAVSVYHGRSGWLPFILVALVSLLWGILVIPRTGRLPAGDPLFWLQNGRTFLTGNPLYWLYLPFIGAGLWDLWTWQTTDDTGHTSDMAISSGKGGPRTAPTGRLIFVFLLLWAAAAVLARSTMAPLIFAFVAIVFSALGAAWLSRRDLASGRLDISPHVAQFVPLLFTIPLLLAGLLGLYRLYHARPIQQVALQDQAASWLSANADAETTLYAPPRVGYQAGLAVMPALVDHIRDSNVATVYELLLGQNPRFIVSENSFAWDYITRTNWFQERYRQRAQFANAYAQDSPLTIWEYTPSPYDEGGHEAITAVVDDRFALVGYQFEPRVIEPGQDVFLTLYLQALQPLDYGFVTGVHLSAADGWVWSWREEQTPRAIAGQWWEPGQVIPEGIQLQTTADIPLGAYDLQVFWRAGDEKSNWPIALDGGEHVVDRLDLGYVVAPPPVDTQGATPVNAQFGESILLDSYAISASPAAGQTLDVTLYWQALNTLPADYTVFVHLLDEQGRLVAAHDGMPADNGFPTGAWPPGLLVEDKHTITLPPDLPPGTYQVNVGLYLFETGERLPVSDAAGLEQPNRSLPLTTVTSDR